MNSGRKPIIGLIGAIGAGKSTAAAIFALRGGLIVDADALGHQSLDQPEIRDRVADRWGETVVLTRGRVDRRELGKIVFANESERLALEAIVFPFIKARAEAEIERGMADRSFRFIILDAAVMMEAGWEGICDRIVYIDAPRSLRQVRLAERSGWTAGELDRRECAQWPADRKRARADAIIENEADLERLTVHIDRTLAAFGIPADGQPDARVTSPRAG